MGSMIKFIIIIKMMKLAGTEDLFQKRTYLHLNKRKAKIKYKMGFIHLTKKKMIKMIRMNKAIKNSQQF